MNQHDSENLRRMWEEYFRGASASPTQAAGKRSLTVDYTALAKEQPELAEQILARPTVVLAAATAAIEQLSPASKPRVRVANLPDSTRVSLRDLRSHHVHRLAAIAGLVSRVGEVRPQVKVSCWRCARCDALIKEPVDADSLALVKPATCYEDQGGCGAGKLFRREDERASYDDIQEVTIEHEGTSHVFRVEGDLCNVVHEEDVVTLNCIVRAAPGKERSVDSAMCTFRFDVLGIGLTKRADSPRSRSKAILGLVRQLGDGNDAGAPREVIIERACASLNISKQEAQAVLDRLNRDGRVLQPPGADGFKAI